MSSINLKINRGPELTTLCVVQTNRGNSNSITGSFLGVVWIVGFIGTNREQVLKVTFQNGHSPPTH